MNPGSNEEWLEALGISLKAFSNRVDIMANRSRNLRSGSTDAITVVGYSKKKASQPTAQQRNAEMAYAEAALADSKLTTTRSAKGQQLYTAAEGVFTSAAANITGSRRFQTGYR
jgi:hypothetical protein